MWIHKNGCKIKEKCYFGEQRAIDRREKWRNPIFGIRLWVVSKVFPTLRKNGVTASSRIQGPSFLTFEERGHLFLRITDNHFQGEAMAHSGRRNRRSYLHGIRLDEWLLCYLPSWRRKSALLSWQRRGRARACVCVYISSFKTVDGFLQKDAGINGTPLDATTTP
jgi:hypothetical protein